MRLEVQRALRPGCFPNENRNRNGRIRRERQPIIATFLRAADRRPESGMTAHSIRARRIGTQERRTLRPPFLHGRRIVMTVSASITVQGKSFKRKQIREISCGVRNHSGHPCRASIRGPRIFGRVASGVLSPSLHGHRGPVRLRLPDVEAHPLRECIGDDHSACGSTAGGGSAAVFDVRRFAYLLSRKYRIREK